MSNELKKRIGFRIVLLLMLVISLTLVLEVTGDDNGPGPPPSTPGPPSTNELKKNCDPDPCDVYISLPPPDEWEPCPIRGCWELHYDPPCNCWWELNQECELDCYTTFGPENPNLWWFYWAPGALNVFKANSYYYPEQIDCDEDGDPEYDCTTNAGYRCITGFHQEIIESACDNDTPRVTIEPLHDLTCTDEDHTGEAYANVSIDPDSPPGWVKIFADSRSCHPGKTCDSSEGWDVFIIGVDLDFSNLSESEEENPPGQVIVKGEWEEMDLCLYPKFDFDAFNETNPKWGFVFDDYYVNIKVETSIGWESLVTPGVFYPKTCYGWPEEVDIYGKRESENPVAVTAYYINYQTQLSSGGVTSDTVYVTVIPENVEIDLDMDSNNDGVISEVDDPIENTPGLPGNKTMLNDDDDNQNCILDMKEQGIVEGEDDLSLLLIDINPNDLAEGPGGEIWEWKLIYKTTAVKIYNPETEEIIKNNTWFSLLYNPPPENLLVEGLSESKEYGEEKIKGILRYEDFETEDTVQATIINFIGSDYGPGNSWTIDPTKPDVNNINPGESYANFFDNRGLGNDLQIDPTTGNVHLSLVICPPDEGQPGFTIRYNSLNANITSTLGPGWTHSYNILLNESHLESVIVIDGHGLYSEYIGTKEEGFIRPEQRKAELSYTNQQYQLQYTDGAQLYFTDLSSSGDYFIETYIDSHGKETKLIYDNSGQLTTIIFSPKQFLEFEYYDSGQLQMVKHINGAKTYFYYNDDDELKNVTDPYENPTSFLYDDTHRLTKVTLRNGVTYSVQYEDDPEGCYAKRYLRDGDDNLMYRIESSYGFPTERPGNCLLDIVYVTDGKGYVWNYYRNEQGQRTCVETPEQSSYIFDHYSKEETGAYLWKEITLPKEYSIKYSYDDYNNLKKITDQKDNALEYEYNDPHFPALPTVRKRGNRNWHIEYDDHGFPVTITDPKQNEISFDYTYWDGPDTRIKEQRTTNRIGNVYSQIFDIVEQLLYDKTILDPRGDESLTKTEWNYSIFPQSKRVLTMTDRDQGRHEEVEKYIVRDNYDLLGRLMETSIDPNGLNLRYIYNYDKEGHLQTIANPKATITKYTYDHRGRIKTIIQDYGYLDLTTTYKYDKNGNVENITDPSGNITFFSYDKQNRLNWTKDVEDYITKYEYDKNSNIISVIRSRYPGTLEDGFKTNYSYDEFDRCVKIIIDPEGYQLQTEYEYVEDLTGGQGTDNNLIHKLTDPEGKITYYYYDEQTELLKKVVQKINDIVDNGGDDDDSITSYYYDAEGTLNKTIDPIGMITEFKYDKANRISKKIVDPGKERLEWAYSYKGADLYNITLPNGNVITVEFDDAGRPEHIYDRVGTIQSQRYDANSNVEYVSDALGRMTQYIYNSLDQCTGVRDPEYYWTTYQYDDNGNLVIKNDPNGIITKYNYNALGWVTGFIQNYTGESIKTTMEYNGLNQIEKLIDDLGNQTRYIYDSVGNLREIHFPDYIKGTDPTDYITYEYDKVENLRFQTDQNGNTIELLYDDLHRLNKTIYPPIGEQPGYSDVYTYYKSGKLQDATNPYASWHFEYDTVDRLDWFNQQITGLEGTYITDYDYNLGEYSTITVDYPGDRVLTESLDLRFRPREITVEPGSISSIYWPNDADELKEIHLGNDIYSNYSYDKTGRVEEIWHSLSGCQDKYHIQYDYDAIGNRLYKRELLGGWNSELYSYDSYNRLVDFQRGILNQQGDAITEFTNSEFLTQQQHWGLDSNGNWRNLMQMINDGSYEENRTVNEVNEYRTIDDGSTVIFLEYDPTGNLINNSYYNYTYGAQNRLLNILDLDTFQQTNFTYGPLGNKVTITQNGETIYLLYDGATTIQERKADGTLLREYIPGVSGLLAMVDHTWSGDKPPSEDEVLYYLQDALGSTVLLTNEDGDTVEKYCYDPYGKTFILDPIENNERPYSHYGNPFMWTGQRYDNNNDLYHFWARSYSPILGRWLQRDPLGYVDGMNQYEYVGSSPPNFVDPSGLDRVQADLIFKDNSLSHINIYYVDESNWKWLGDKDAEPYYIGRLNLEDGYVYRDDRKRIPLETVHEITHNWRTTKKKFEKKFKPPDSISIGQDNALGRKQQVYEELGIDMPSDEMAWHLGATELAADLVKDLAWFYALAPLDLIGQIKSVKFFKYADGISIIHSDTRRAGNFLKDVKFAQVKYTEQFSDDGLFAGKYIDDVARALRKGELSPKSVRIDYIVENGQKIILNTRSAEALRRAGIPMEEWWICERTGQYAYEARLSHQLGGNALKVSNGINELLTGR